MRKVNYGIIGLSGLTLLIGGGLLYLYEWEFHPYLPLFMIFSSIAVFAVGGEYWSKHELNKHLGKYEDERTRRIETNARAKSYRMIQLSFPLLFFLGTSPFEGFILLLFYSFVLFAPLVWQVKLGKEL